VADGRRSLAIVVGGAVAGLVLGLAVTVVTDDVYRATALLEVTAAADPQVPGAAVPLPSQVLAESYAKLLSEESFLAGIAPQVAAGRFDAEELADRVNAEQAGDSAVVELQAEGGTRQEAQAVATDVVSAFLALVQQLSRQRTQQLEDDLRRRLDALPPARVAEQRALAAEVARIATRGVEQATSVRLAGPAYSSPDRVWPNTFMNLAGGLLLGLVAGLGATMLRRREPVIEPAVEPVPEPVPAAVLEPVPGTGGGRRAPEPAPEPAPVGVDETPPRVALSGPEPQSTVSGTVALRIEAWDDESGVAELELLVSDGSADWHALARFATSRAESLWDTETVADGVYWLSAVARDRAGHAAASEPLPLLVENAPNP
jgi:capsular polysaccharide biosynthesis protein